MYSNRNYSFATTFGKNPFRNYKRSRKRRAELYRRRVVKSFVPRGIRMRRHSFKQQFYPGTGSVTVAGMTYPSAGNLVGPTSGGGTDGAFSIFFQIADLPQVASFSALFDEYRVNKIVYKFIPALDAEVHTATITDTVTPFQMQYLNTVIDFDDATNLTSMNQLFEYESCVTTRAGRVTKRVFVPSISNELYRTGGGTIGYGRKSKQWIDMAYTDVPHYGIKGYVDHYNAAQIAMRWKVICVVYLSFRQVR